MKKIAVDLTPVLPGGANGGVKIMTLELIRNLSRLFPQCQFILLTNAQSNQELACLDAINVSRVIATEMAPKKTFFKRAMNKILRHLAARSKHLAAVFSTYLETNLDSTKYFKANKIDLLFCPFMGLYYNTPSTPTVTVICDLQYLTYPQFFSEPKCKEQANNFKQVCKHSTKLVCISDYTKRSVIQANSTVKNKTDTIYIQLPLRLAHISQANSNATLKQYGLVAEEFLLYPANFWQHKNHHTLITAFNSYLIKHPNSALKLICSGTPDNNMLALQARVADLKLNEKILFAGYLKDEQLLALFQHCKALIFPSLYEGFGMPIVEAMATGKPVLCSKVTSLPEIAGDAALMFDPKCHDAIMQAIEQLVQNSQLKDALIAKGKQRAQLFSNAEQMAYQYWQIFQAAVASQHECITTTR